VFVVTGLTVLFLALAGAGEPSYVGAKGCKMCHIKQFKSWEATKMAQSFEVLKPGVKAEEKKLAGLDAQADYTADPECLPCHTTGYGEPGGFVSLAETPELAGVQCESCHGPGERYLADDMMSLKNKEYKRDAIVATGLVIPDSGTCTSGCHNDKSPFHKPDEVFDFETSKNEGTHKHIALKYPH
jgi:Zn finger protein HypA/HybF involved in hydrogenase expression